MTAARAFRDIPLAGGKLRLYPRLFSAQESARYLDALKREVDWKSERIALFGRSVALPRKTAWFGDPGMRYTYSGISLEPVPWTPTLLGIRSRVEEANGATFNSVLLNFYRDGRDSVSWHSDDEPELGEDPVIGSVSFGSERPFHLRHKAVRAMCPESAPQPAPSASPVARQLTLSLPNGSHLEMGAGIQRSWMHQLPKRPRLTEERINLTFRNILDRRP
jgi:alkylated DNA repair dioxygenase AlkB